MIYINPRINALLDFFILGMVMTAASAFASDHSDNDGLKMRGEFTLSNTNRLPSIDLAAEGAQITLNHLSRDGVLVGHLPIELFSNQRNHKRFAVYETLSGVEPKAKLRLKALKKPGRYSFDLGLSKTAMERPEECEKKTLLTHFVIDDGSATPVPVETLAIWRCNKQTGGQAVK